jgi:phage-related protein
MLSFIFDAIDSVIGQITSITRTIEDAVQSPINGFINAIGGGAWRGTGADAFVSEMNEVVLPEVGNLIASLTGGGGFIPGINNAINLISELDDMISNIGSAIGDLFDSIF